MKQRGVRFAAVACFFLIILIGASLFYRSFSSADVSRRKQATKFSIIQSIENGDYSAASAQINRFEQVFGTEDFEIYSLRGDVMALTGDFDESVKAYSRAIHIRNSINADNGGAGKVLLERKLEAVKEGRLWTEGDLFKRGTSSKDN